MFQKEEEYVCPASWTCFLYLSTAGWKRHHLTHMHTHRLRSPAQCADTAAPPAPSSHLATLPLLC